MTLLEFSELLAEVARSIEYLTKLPKDADDWPIIPPTKMWYVDSGVVRAFYVTGIDYESHWWGCNRVLGYAVSSNRLHRSREAAEAALMGEVPRPASAAEKKEVKREL